MWSWCIDGQLYRRFLFLGGAVLILSAAASRSFVCSMLCLAMSIAFRLSLRAAVSNMLFVDGPVMGIGRVRLFLTVSELGPVSSHSLGLSSVASGSGRCSPGLYRLRVSSMDLACRRSFWSRFVCSSRSPPAACRALRYALALRPSPAGQSHALCFAKFPLRVCAHMVHHSNPLSVSLAVFRLCRFIRSCCFDMCIASWFLASCSVFRVYSVSQKGQSVVWGSFVAFLLSSVVGFGLVFVIACSCDGVVICFVL